MNREPSVHEKVQRACEEHLEDLYYKQEFMEDGLYCGCTTCIVREVLNVARPYFTQLALAEFRDSVGKHPT